MAAIEYRMFFNDESATRTDLDRVEEIVVEQQVDMAWQARIKLPIEVNEKGVWDSEGDPLLAPTARMRVEIKVGKRPWVALIDGQIVAPSSQMSGQPGESTITVAVNDDSTLLNQKDVDEQFEKKSDQAIAELLFKTAGEHIASIEIDHTPLPPNEPSTSAVQRGTAMHLLRELARRQGMHAYVLPGNEPGRSVGCLKAFTRKLGDLPQLVLLGADRNLQTLDVNNSAQRPTTVRACTLRLSDKKVLCATSSAGDINLLGQEAALEKKPVAQQILGPESDYAGDPKRAVAAVAQRSSYAFEARGRVLTGCYSAALLPYQLVNVIGADGQKSGDYEIHQVTHLLTRSTYTQSFVLKRNARSGGTGAGPVGPLGVIV
jgi:hypothetical protein